MRWPYRQARTTPHTEPQGVVPERKTFVVEGEFHRTEELRPDVIGVPSEDEVKDDGPHDPWRPSRTLGKLPYN
jgi:hypothetical protein